MDSLEAYKATVAYYTANAFLGNMEGYTTDDLVEWTAWTMHLFVTESVTRDDLAALQSELDD